MCWASALAQTEPFSAQFRGDLPKFSLGAPPLNPMEEGACGTNKGGIVEGKCAPGRAHFDGLQPFAPFMPPGGRPWPCCIHFNTMQVIDYSCRSKGILHCWYALQCMPCLAVPACIAVRVHIQAYHRISS